MMLVMFVMFVFLPLCISAFTRSLSIYTHTRTHAHAHTRTTQSLFRSATMSLEPLWAHVFFTTGTCTFLNLCLL